MNTQLSQASLAVLLNAKRREEEEEEEEERKRLEAAGDKEKLSAYFDQVLSVEVPTMKSNEATGILALMHNCIQVCVLKIEKL
jgi:CO dehydrogenase/acetyl-CoA synthase beta subunit